jgi:hypothetical protein
MDTPQLKLAQDFVQFTGANIFLTGKAGTGKTTFLNRLKQNSPKRMIVTAPTGVAAINAGGVTIHSFFQLPFGPQVIQKTNGSTTSDSQKYINKFSREKINIIRSLDLLVIDEISMVRADLLDAVDSVLRRYKNRFKPFGGVQLLMIGDLQQLAPVVKEDDWKILKDYYETPFFFSSQALCKTQFVCIELQHIFRQNDEIFINLLNKIRDNRLDKDALEILNSRFIPDFDIDKSSSYITLTTHNQQASRINFIHMNQIEKPASIFSAEISGIFPEYSYPNEIELLLKPGAQVMFVKNDTSKEKRFYNGKIGTITSIEDELVFVSCPGDDDEIVVEPVEWHNYSYTIDEETDEIVENLLGTFKQIPLKPAWAITIHKSQGLTFEKAIIDTNAAFAHGQVYVAFSRCRTLEGIVLCSKINPNSLRTDDSVLNFIKDIEINQPDNNKLSELKKDFEKSLLTDLNDFSALQRRLEHCRKIILENESVLQGKPANTCNVIYEAIKAGLIEVSQKFLLQINRLLYSNPDIDSNDELQDRLKKAGIYYIAKINDIQSQFYETFVLDTDNKTVKRSIKEAVEKLDDEFKYKLACMDAVTKGFSVISYLKARSIASIEKEPVKKKAKAEKISTNIKSAEDVISAEILNPKLYKLLKDWRNEKSSELRQPVYIIIPQKTLIEMSNKLPQTVAQLKTIKGIGDKKIQLYGKEMLYIISNYSKENSIE